MTAPANPTLAAIIEEVRSQVANFQTVILKTGHALRLVAIAEAAMEAERDPWGGGMTALRRALASPANGAGEEGE